MTREQLFRFFSLGALLFLLYQALHILSPFYTGILGAIVLTLIFFPLHRLILKSIGPKNPNICAGASTLAVSALIVVPLFFLSWLLFHELTSIYPLMERIGNKISGWRHGEIFIDSQWLQTIQSQLQGIMDLTQIDLQKIATGTAETIIEVIANFGRKLPKNAFLTIINVLVMVFTMFFLFRDGAVLFRKIKELVPMEQKHKEQIASQLYITVTAVVRGVFVVAVAQGTLAGIGFFMARVPSPVSLGFCTTFVALIPVIGAGMVWLPVSLYYLIQGSIGKGVFLFLWGSLVITLVDNFLRPILIGSKARLPVLFLFFGILGGIKVYGPMGLFLGPLVVALVIAFIKIYQEEYSQNPRQIQEKKNG